MELPVIENMEIVGVADRGVPNKERILLRPRVEINLQNFIVGLGRMTQSGARVSMFDNFVFYFEDIIAEQMSWVVVYTGTGRTEVSRLPTTHEKAYSFHWGHKNVLFADQQVIPILFQVAALGFENAETSELPSSSLQLT